MGCSLEPVVHLTVFTTQCYASAVLAMGLCLSVCSSHSFRLGCAIDHLNKPNYKIIRKYYIQKAATCAMKAVQFQNYSSQQLEQQTEQF